MLLRSAGQCVDPLPTATILNVPCQEMECVSTLRSLICSGEALETDAYRRAASRDACLSVGFSMRFLFSTCDATIQSSPALLSLLSSQVSVFVRMLSHAQDCSFLHSALRSFSVILLASSMNDQARKVHGKASKVHCQMLCMIS